MKQTRTQPSPVTPFEGGVRLTIKARPNVTRPCSMRLVEIGEGRQAIEVPVAAVAEDGKANKAILAALADVLPVKKAGLSIKAGQTGRVKVVEVAGEPDFLMTCAAKWIAGLS